MGMPLFSPGDTTPSNPDPKDFKIRLRHNSGVYSYLLVHYPACTTFAGEKILLVKNLPEEVTELDPHFLEGNNVLARFRPSIEGRSLAWRVFNELVGRD